MAKNTDSPVRLVRDCLTSQHEFRDLYGHPPPKYMIPFFGDLLKAQALTVGLNPSSREFATNRCWNDGLTAKGLATRLSAYFSPGKHTSFVTRHPWFDQWDTVLTLYGYSYAGQSNNSLKRAAHLDLSPRATRAVSTVTRTADERSRFLRMVRQDLQYFFRALRLARRAQVVFMAGSVTGRYYMNEFLHVHAHEYGYLCHDDVIVIDRNPYATIFTLSEIGTTTRGRGRASTSGTLRLASSLPVYFCGTGPSANNGTAAIRDALKRLNEVRRISP